MKLEFKTFIPCPFEDTDILVSVLAEYHFAKGTPGTLIDKAGLEIEEIKVLFDGADITDTLSAPMINHLFDEIADKISREKHY